MHEDFRVGHLPYMVGRLIWQVPALSGPTGSDMIGSFLPATHPQVGGRLYHPDGWRTATSQVAFIPPPSTADDVPPSLFFSPGSLGS